MFVNDRTEPSGSTHLVLVAVQLLEEVLGAVPRRLHALAPRLLLDRQPRLQRLVLQRTSHPRSCRAVG